MFSHAGLPAGLAFAPSLTHMFGRNFNDDDEEREDISDVLPESCVRLDSLCVFALHARRWFELIWGTCM